MSCNDEITSIEQVAPGAQNGSAGGGAGEETNLYEFIDRDKVGGSPPHPTMGERVPSACAFGSVLTGLYAVLLFFLLLP